MLNLLASENSMERPSNRLGRRCFIRRGTLALAGLAMGRRSLAGRAVAQEKAARATANLTFGLVTDVHYADKAPEGSRYYRDSMEKLRHAVAVLNKRRPDLVVQCGDLIDSGSSLEKEADHLRAIEAEMSRCHGERHYVFGNHCLYQLSKKEFSELSAARPTHYSFDHGRWHGVVLDACFTSKGEPYQRKNFRWTDANIPDAQIAWLTDDLRRTKLPTLVFTHQRLDPSGKYMIRNAEKVRKVLADAGNVAAVFQGHSHQNFHREIDGIHYCVTRGMIEGEGLKNNGFALVSGYPDGSLSVEGFGKQVDRQLGSQKKNTAT